MAAPVFHRLSVLSLSSACTAVLLAACGGGSGGTADTVPAGGTSTAEARSTSSPNANANSNSNANANTPSSTDPTTTSPAPAPAPAPSGPTYYISPNGNDSNPGTMASPWRTIQKAANSVVAGDTVVLLNGTYETGSVNFSRSGTASKPVTFMAQNKWAAIVNSTSGCNPGFSINASYIKVKDIRFSVSPNNANCTTYTSSNVHIRAWNSINPSPSNPTTGHVGFHADGIKVDGGAARSEGVKSNQDFTIIENSESGNALEIMGSRDSIIRNNLVTGQDQYGISIFAKGGVRNAQIYNNVIRNKHSNGSAIYLGGFSCDACFFDTSTKIEAYNSVAYNNVVINEGGGNMVGLMFQGAKDSAFYNNVVIGGQLSMTPGGHNSGFQAATTNPTFKNNIVVCNGKSVASSMGWSYSGTLTVDHNNFYNCSGAPAQAHPVNGDPMITNNSSDWHLKAGSPALNTGTPVTMPAYGGGSIDISRDKDGTVRAAPWDLGVYNQ